MSDEQAAALLDAIPFARLVGVELVTATPAEVRTTALMAAETAPSGRRNDPYHIYEKRPSSETSLDGKARHLWRAVGDSSEARKRFPKLTKNFCQVIQISSFSTQNAPCSRSKKEARFPGPLFFQDVRWNG